MKELEILRKRLAEALPELELRTDEPMSRHTTFRIGGPARLMALPKTEEELAGAVRLAAGFGEECLIIGNGSNLLVDDAGLDRFVVKTAPGLSSLHVEGESISAGCGVTLAALAAAAADRGLSGLAFAHGIPGSVGGAVVMNAGAYGGEMSQVTALVRWLDPAGAVHETPGAACSFGYRHSAFSDGGRFVLSARFDLRLGDPEEIRAEMRDLMGRRREKQPLEYPSAGSVFKRPEGHFAAALIDRCGLKGLRVGGAQVSEKHAGFIVNTGGATCADVLALIEQIRQRVFAETGVELETEVKYLK